MALKHLQPVKRRRGKPSAEDPAGATKRRRCRVSDEEYERLRLAKSMRQQPLPSQDHAARPTHAVVILIASPAVRVATQ